MMDIAIKQGARPGENATAALPKVSIHRFSGAPFINVENYRRIVAGVYRGCCITLLESF
jgi:hypothetical protein